MAIQITITGEPGCGKTTVSKLVAQLLGVSHLSTGFIQREIAHKLGVTTLELNRMADKDRKIDEQIDAHTIEVAKGRHDVVVDSRLAWRFLPGSLKVFLVCPTTVAATRVIAHKRAAESYETPQHAIDALVARYESETTRFFRHYGASLGNLRNYDLVIDTSYASPELIAEHIAMTARARTAVSVLPILLIDPKSLIPVESIREVSDSYLAPVREHFGTSRVASGDVGPLVVVRAGGSWVIRDGHKRTALGLDEGAKFLSAVLDAQDDEVIEAGMTARSFATEDVKWHNIYDWEDRFDFRFARYPTFLSADGVKV